MFADPISYYRLTAPMKKRIATTCVKEAVRRFKDAGGAKAFDGKSAFMNDHKFSFTRMDVTHNSEWQDIEAKKNINIRVIDAKKDELALSRAIVRGLKDKHYKAQLEPNGYTIKMWKTR